MITHAQNINIELLGLSLTARKLAILKTLLAIDGLSLKKVDRLFRQLK